MHFPRIIFLLVLLGLGQIERAAADGQPRRFMLLLCDGLSLDDLRNPALPELSRLAQTSRIGLLNTATGGGRPEQASILPLLFGSMAPAEPTDLDVYPTSFGPIERADAATVFRRRTGLIVQAGGNNSPEASPLVHLGIAPLTARGLNQALPGALLARTGRPGSLIAGGLARGRSGVFVVDSRGIGPPGRFSEKLSAAEAAKLAAWASAERENLVVDLGGGRSGEAALESFLGSLGSSVHQIRILLIAPQPKSRRLDRLAVALLSSPGEPPGTLSSETTHTDGLIANIDVAPTLLRWLGVDPPASATGHLITGRADSNALGLLQWLDRRITLNGQGLAPTAATLGGIVILALAGSAAALLRWPRLRATCRFSVLALMAAPLAMLLVVPLAPSSVPLLAVEIVAIMAAIAGAALGIGATRLHGGDSALPPLFIAGLTVGVILLDSLLGGTLVKFSLLSGYQIQGIRFYGIGNEYMGALLGLALLSAYLPELRIGPALAIFAMVTFVLGAPMLGAKAGGIVTAFAVFGPALMDLSGRKVGWQAFAVWSVIGFGAAFTTAELERAVGGAGTHMAGALGAANQLGVGYLVEIIERKVRMNVRILTLPATLTAIATVGGAILAGRTALKVRLERLRDNRPGFARGARIAAFGALAALLFNDSGIVAALFLSAAFVTSGLYLLLAESD